MDFFTHQDKAKSQTNKLIVLFSLAVLLIILAINGLALVITNMNVSEPFTLQQWLALPYWAGISIAIILIIFITSFFRTWQLNKSPDAVAKMVNATPVSTNTQNLKLRQLLNIVEEMSIASGMPIPKVYIMQDELSINAFVSGLSQNNVCLVVTQGLLENLNRQELQGVIAHEYSHVFHGDMNINVRLIGVLAGILVIGQIGEFFLHSMNSSRHSRDSRGNAFPVFVVGIGLFAIGYIGLFFGRLIKAAISRQREFLADASAVQYTRDRVGICGALMKIKQHTQGTLITNKKAEEISHLCFGQAIKLRLNGLLATHPSIDKRIHKLDPSFNLNNPTHRGANRATRYQTEPSPIQQFKNADSYVQHASQNFSLDPTASIVAASCTHSDTVEKPKPDEVLEQVGQISLQSIIAAEDLIAHTPSALLKTARGEDPINTEKEMLIALLLTEHINDKRITNKLKSHQQKINVIQALCEQIQKLPFAKQHLLFELALHQLTSREKDQQTTFAMQIHSLYSDIPTPSLTVFMIYAITLRRIASSSPEKSKSVNKFAHLSNEITLLLQLLYQQDSRNISEKEKDLKRQLRLLGINNHRLTAIDINHNEVAKNLNQLATLHPLLKKDLLKICIAIIEKDNTVNQTEYAILRLVGEFLDCPVPMTIQSTRQ